MIAQQAQPHSTEQESPGASAPAETSSQPSFSVFLEQQLAQAIQPVLDDFWHQVAQALEQGLSAEPATVAAAAGARPEPHQEAPSLAQQGPAELAEPQPPSPVPTEGAEQKQSAPTGEQQPAQPAQPTESAGQVSERAASTKLLAPTRQLTESLGPVVQFVERQTELWLQSLLVAGLTALLVESAHAAVRQRAEQGLHTLLLKTFERLPAGAKSQELQTHTETTLQAILAETLVVIFTESMRAAMQRQGEQAIHESVHGHVGAAVKSLEVALEALLVTLMAVLRRQWQRVLRLLLKVVLLAIETSLERSVAGDSLEPPAAAAKIA